MIYRVVDNEGAMCFPSWEAAVDFVDISLRIARNYAFLDFECWIEDGAGNLIGGPLTVADYEAGKILERQAA